MPKFPSLIPSKFCKTDIEIIPYNDDLDEDGAPIELDPINVKCNYQGSSKRVLTAQKEEIQLNGVALIPGLINVKKGTLKVIISGEVHEIFSVTPSYNPDGTINYTKIEVV